MKKQSELPASYKGFVQRFPRLAEAWALTREAGGEGPLDERTIRLIKLGITIGAFKEGATHAAVRKALAVDIPREAMEQVVVLAAGTIGFSAAVAAYAWISDTIDSKNQ